MFPVLRSLWSEPRPARPHTPPWGDRALVAVLVPVAAAEALLRDDVSMRPLAAVLGGVMVATLLWRRARPLVATLVALGAGQLLELVASALGGGPTELYTTVAMLLLPYSLLRWGSGREAIAGLLFLLLSFLLEALGGDIEGPEEGVGGLVVLLFPAALGASVRFRAGAQAREVERARLREREDLARELHDTVAHHVSAIAVQAQAGQAVAATRPEAALQSLGVIEEAAARTLTELRTMVGALRDDGAAALAPQNGLGDLEQLVRAEVGPPVVVERSGDLSGLLPSVDAALYRLAQESVTNARRHAKGASRITVRVDGDEDEVRLTVVDDGRPSAASKRGAGFGLIGMAERAALLGGTFAAGPAEGGWKVEAALPRRGGGST